MYFSPDGRSAALFGFENAIEMSARREATFCRNDVVAVVGTFCHHLLAALNRISLSHILKVDFRHWSK